MKLCSNRFLLVFLLIFIRISTAFSQSSGKMPLQSEKLKYAREVEQEAIVKNDSTLFAEAYYLYGKIYVDAGDYLEGKRYFMKSLLIVEQQDEVDKVSRIYSRLAWLEREQSNLDKALEYARAAMTYARKSTQKARMSAYNSMGYIYFAICRDSLEQRGKHSLQDSVLYYLKLTNQLAHRLNDSITIASISGQLGEIYGFQHDPKAFHYFQSALKIHKAQNHISRQAVVSLQLATTHLLFKQPEKAYPFLQQANALYKSLQSRELRVERDLANAYMEYYRQKKYWQEAFEQSLLARRYEQEQMTADRNGAVSRLSVEYDTKKQKAELENHRRELKLSQQNERTQRWLLFVLSVLLFGTIGATVVFYRISKKNHRLSRQNEILVQEQNHRVKNNLQLISSLLNLQSSQLTDDNAKKAVEDSQLRIEVMGLLQRRLYDGDQSTSVHVADFIKEITEMVLLTYEMEDVDTTYEIPDTLTLPADYVMRIGLIVNELVVNACKYDYPEQARSYAPANDLVGKVDLPSPDCG
jgi:two-component sensor histidine kinase